MKAKVRIKPGVVVMQDHHFGRWPGTASGEPIDPDTVFDAELVGETWICRADGFGRRTWEGDPGGYGNGAFFVRGVNSVIRIDAGPEDTAIYDSIARNYTKDGAAAERARIVALLREMAQGPLQSLFETVIEKIEETR